MPRNPFTVIPGTDFGPGLMGLAQTVERVGERKKAEQKEQIMREEISAAIQSKDADKIRSVAGKYPELGTKIKDIMEMKLPGGSADAYKNALFLASNDFTQAPQILENLRTQFAQDGIDPQEQAKLDKFQSSLELDPETAQKNVEAEFALLTLDDKELWDRYEDIKGEPAKTSTTAMGAYLKQKPDATPDEIVAFAQKLKKEPAAKAGQQYLLDDGRTRTSFDGGRTYVEDGKTYPMPANAIKRAAITGEEAAMDIAKRQLGESTDKPVVPPDQRDMVEAAKSGTGPIAMFKATIDAVLGGAELDTVFGLDGFFPATQENRQALRTIKQLGKAALMNSSRGAIWEQEKIDRLFPDPDKMITNPRTEAKKLKVIRETLLIEKRFNNEAIPSTVTPKELADLRKSNTEIDRLLALIGTGEDTIATVSNTEEYNAVPSGSQYKDPQGNVRTKR